MEGPQAASTNSDFYIYSYCLLSACSVTVPEAQRHDPSARAIEALRNDRLPPNVPAFPVDAKGVARTDACENRAVVTTALSVRPAEEVSDLYHGDAAVAETNDFGTIFGHVDRDDPNVRFIV